jgi:hypothetical protein
MWNIWLLVEEEVALEQLLHPVVVLVAVLEVIELGRLG